MPVTCLSVFTATYALLNPNWSVNFTNCPVDRKRARYYYSSKYTIYKMQIQGWEEQIPCKTRFYVGTSYLNEKGDTFNDVISKHQPTRFS